MVPPFTTKPSRQLLYEKLSGIKLSPGARHLVPLHMDWMHAQLCDIVVAILRAKEQAFVFELHPYSVTYNARGVIVNGLVRYRAIPEGSFGHLGMAAFLHCLQELDSPRLCACPECQRVFLRTGRRRFCSDRCTSRARRTYRQKYPERHKRSAALAARKRYEKKITQGGTRKAKVSARKRKY